MNSKAPPSNTAIASDSTYMCQHCNQKRALKALHSCGHNTCVVCYLEKFEADKYKCKNHGIFSKGEFVDTVICSFNGKDQNYKTESEHPGQFQIIPSLKIPGDLIERVRKAAETCKNTDVLQRLLPRLTTNEKAVSATLLAAEAQQFASQPKQKDPIGMQFQCTICMIKLPSQQALQEHSKTHQGPPQPPPGQVSPPMYLPQNSGQIGMNNVLPGQVQNSPQLYQPTYNQPAIGPQNPGANSQDVLRVTQLTEEIVQLKQQLQQEKQVSAQLKQDNAGLNQQLLSAQSVMQQMTLQIQDSQSRFGQSQQQIQQLQHELQQSKNTVTQLQQAITRQNVKLTDASNALYTTQAQRDQTVVQWQQLQSTVTELQNQLQNSIRQPVKQVDAVAAPNPKVVAELQEALKLKDDFIKSLRPSPNQAVQHHCSNCFSIFLTKSDLREHVKSCMQSYPCRICQEVFRTQELALQHETTHDEMGVDDGPDQLVYILRGAEPFTTGEVNW